MNSSKRIGEVVEVILHAIGSSTRTYMSNKCRYNPHTNRQSIVSVTAFVSYP
jgi:hypothetical protein